MALKRATTDKGISFYSLTSELNKAGTSAAKLTATLASGGQAFATSLNAANTAFAVADRSVISLNGKIKEMSRVLTQSFKFTAAQTFLQGVSNAAQEAYRWVYDLNKTITDISVVTGYQGDQLDKITRNAIEGAQELRIAANEYAKGALIFYQQGLGDDEVAQRVEITAKAARASGQSLDQMSSQLTAIWNTYKMTGDEMQRAASVGAKMAGDTAVDFADIAEAMQTAAAPAEQMGVSYNSLAAIIATVGDTTQQSASVIGNAFKTIFSRFQQLKSEGTDGEVTLNRVSSQLQELGVKVLDASGELRSLDSVIAEVGGQWDSWSSKQQLAIAQLVGGTRQYGQFLTLMNNFDKYQDLLSSANIEDGSTLEQQYESSLNSIESHAENAAESMRRAFGQIFDEDTLIAAYSTIEGIGGILETIIKTLGGGLGIINAIAAALSAKVGPALANNAQKATLLVNNLTYSGRKSNIDKEYNDKDAELQNRLDQGAVGAERESLLIAKQKNDFSRKTAEINEQINTLLRNATGEERIRLQIKQQNLKTAQEEYQASLDQLHNLDGEIKKEQQLLDLQQKRKVAEAAVQVNEAKQAQRENINRQYNARQKLNGLDQSVAAQMANKEQAGDNWTQDQEDRLTETLRKQAQAQDELNDAMAEGLVIEERLQIAREELVNVTNDSAHATNQSILTINQAFSAWKSGAVESSDQVKSAIKANAETIISEYESIRNGFAQAGMDQEAQEATQRINELRQAIQNIDNADDQALDGILADLNQMGSQLPQVTSRVNDLIQQNSDAILRSGQMRERQANAGSDLNDPNANRSRIGRLVDAGAQRLGSGMGKVSNFLKSNEQIISGIAQIGTSATMVISTVQNMWGVISDPDASVLDKVTSVGTGIAAMVPNIMNVVQGFSKLPPQVAIATVAIGATIAAVALLWNEFQKYTPEAKFKRMSEAAEKLKTDAEEAKTQAEGLKSTIDSYDQAVSNLNNCVKGTEEWKEALKQTNDAARDVISSLSDLENVDLSNLYERDEDGMLKLNQEELDRISAEQDSLATQKEYAAQMAQIQASQLGNQVKAKDIASEYTMGAAGSIATGAATGAVYGTALGGPIGTAIGGLIGGLGGAILNDVNDAAIGEKISENLDELTQLDTDDLRDKLTSFGLNVSGLSDVEIEGLRTRLQNLADSTTAAQEKLEMVAGLAVDEKLGDKYSGEAKDVVTKQVAAEQQKLTEEWTSFMDDNFSKISDGSTEDRNKLVEAFNAAMGTNYTADSNFSRGTDGNRTFAFKNAVTGEIETFTKEYIASTIAAQQALEGLEVSAKEAETMLKNLSVVDTEGNKDDGATQAIRDFISTGNLEGATKGEFETIQQGVEAAGSAQAYLESIGFTPEIAAQYADDFESALAIDWESVTSKLPESFKNSEEVSLAQARGFADTYQKIIGIAGEQAGKEYEGMMTGILNGITDPEMQDQARDILAGIDWTQWDAADQAADALAGIGVELDTGSQSWQNFEASMRSTFKAIPDIKALAESINNVKSISDGLELGSIISYEDYQTLVNFNSELGKYFTILADGTAQMTGDPLDFMQEVQATEQEKLKEQIKAAEDMAKELQGVSGSQNYQGTNGENYYRGSNVQTQLDYIQAYGGADQAQIDKWREDLEDGKSTVETIDAIGAAFDELGMSAETAGNTAQTAMTQLAMTAGSAEERLEMLTPGEDGVKEINESAYGAAAMAAINQEKWEGLDVEEVQNYSDHLQDLAENSELVDKNLKDDAETAEEVARAVMKTNDGIEKLSEGFEDWSDILENSDESSEEYCEALSGMKNALSDVLGVSEEFIDNDFIKENMEDIAKAAKGDAEAIDNLRAALAEDLILDLTVDGSTAEQQALQAHADLTAKLAGKKVGFTVTADMDSTGILTAAQGVVDSAQMSVEEAQAYFNSLGYEPVFEMTEQTVQSKKPITETYTQDNGTSYETYETVNPDGSVSTQTVPFVRTRSFSKIVGYTTQDEVMQVPAISADGTPKITELKKINSGSMNNFSGSNAGGGSPSGGSKGGGGGGSAPKHQAKDVSRREKLTISDRYSSIKASIEDVSRELEDFNSALDDSWGANRLSAMKKINKELQEQGKNYQALAKAAKSYLPKDQNQAKLTRDDVTKKFKELGISGATIPQILFNDDGFVANKTEIVNSLDNYLDQLYNAYLTEAKKFNDAQSTDENWAEKIDKLKEKYDQADEIVQLFLGDLDQVDETANEARQAFLDALQNVKDWMSNKVAELEYKIEFKVNISDYEIKQFERFIERLGEIGRDTGLSFEGYLGMFDSITDKISANIQGVDRAFEILTNINPLETDATWFKQQFGEDVWNEYISSNGALPDEVMQFLQEQKDTLQDLVDELYDAAQDSFDLLIDRIEAMFDKFVAIDDSLDARMNRLDTLQSLVEANGNPAYTEEGRQAQRDINAARTSTLKTQAQSLIKQRDLRAQQLADIDKEIEQRQAEYELAVASGNQQQIEDAAFILNNLQNYRQEVSDEFNSLAADTEAAIQAVIENFRETWDSELELLKGELAESLHGTFYELSQISEMYQAQYNNLHINLDEYDKNYELDRIQRDMDKFLEDQTDPEILSEMAVLQEQLNNYRKDGVAISAEEVDILNKGLAVIKARAEFEDARAAKNTMRLARDASGNWNYVYSNTDTQNTEDAAQNVADAEYEYKKAYENFMNQNEAALADAVAGLEEIISQYDEYLYENNEGFRKWFDTQISIALDNMNKYAANSERATQILENGIIDYRYVFSDNALGIISDTQSLQEFMKQYTTALVGGSYDSASGAGGGTAGGYLGSIISKQHELREETSNDLASMGMKWDDYGEQVEDETTQIIEDNDDTADAIEDMYDRGSDALSDFSRDINTWASNFKSRMAEIRSAIEATIAKIEELERAQSKRMEVGFDEGTDYTAYLTNDYINSGGIKDKEAIRDFIDTYHSDDIYERMNAGADRGIFAGTTYDQAADMIVDHIFGRFDEGMYDSYDYGEKDSEKEYTVIVKPKTGAATGGLFSNPTVSSLAEEGPELVLNKEDTKNILEAVQNMREVVKMKLQVASGKIDRQTENAQPKEIVKTETSQVDQNVHIEASFPNVSVAAEIEEAFSNLVNQAVQYASAKKK